MAFKLTVTEKQGYLHIIVTGNNSVKTVLRYFAEIHRECSARNCFYILIEEHLKGPRLEIFDILKIVTDESKKGRGFFKAIAYVDVNAKDDLMKFAENVAVNRSLPLTVFSSVDNAEKWMINRISKIAKTS